MAMFNNNQRSDLKMSDFRSNMKENNSGAVKFSDLGVFNRATGTSTPNYYNCLLYTSPSPRDRQKSRMPSSA